MTHAYAEYYLEDARDNLGLMLDFATNTHHYDCDEFFSWFISSGIAENFENANPKYICGMSGIELADEVCYRTTGKRLDLNATFSLNRSPEFWAGWILAYYQWNSRVRFEEMMSYSLTPSKTISMYILHEAPESKFFENADRIIAEAKAKSPSKLSTIRKARGMSQHELAEASGVSLRMIQLYEQKQNDISRAQVRTLFYLSQILGCKIEDIIEL
jgi:DNA-binding transcriptional regulator YiaG